MSAVHREPAIRDMPFGLRPMTEADVDQVAKIERDAFPSLFPPTSFRRELRNRMAEYLVAWERLGGEDDGGGPREDGLLKGVLRRARNLWSGDADLWARGHQSLAGFLGLWFVAEEAHVVSIAVRRELRGRGVGELLLIGAVERAMERCARVLTLEVRVSNKVAQNLYRKYGFRPVGLRKAYYTDNREDAVIMTTEPIQEPQYQQLFRQLVAAHEERWGRAPRQGLTQPPTTP